MPCSALQPGGIKGVHLKAIGLLSVVGVSQSKEAEAVEKATQAFESDVFTKEKKKE